MFITGTAVHRKEEWISAGVQLPWQEDTTNLAAPVVGDGFILPNALCVHPMEGCDGTTTGSPDTLTLRRYERFASGGAGLIWLEAVAVVPEGRANPRQLWIREDNLADFVALRQLIDTTAQKAGFPKPTVVVQLTHSGRFSCPEGKPAPCRASIHPQLDAKYPAHAAVDPVSDEYLSTLPQAYAKAARLCKQAGFDGVDIKSCHLYLMSELLGARKRPGQYGGSFANRTRLFLDTLDAVRAENPGIISCRLSAYDGMPFDHGFGVSDDGTIDVNLSEPIQYVKIMWERGVRLLNITMGTPYFNPHVNRPFEAAKDEVLPEPSMVGVHRLLSGAQQIKQAVPGMVIVGTGFSYLGLSAPFVAASGKAEGWFDVAGFGRTAFAYPDFASDILKNGKFTAKKICLCCGKCTQLMRAGTFSGCPVRDQEYTDLYRQKVLGK